MTEQTAAARKVLTTAEKIAQLQARIDADTKKLAELVFAEAAKAAFTNVKAGDIVTFTLGRAETKRTLTGSVLARGEADGKDVVKVIAGEGLATAVYQVEVSKLDSVGPDQEATKAEAPAEDNIDDLLSNVSPETEANLDAVQLS